MARELTDKQKRVLSSLEAYWSMHQVPPSISDLAKQLGINKATAYEHLLALKKKGYLLHQARAGRTWRPAQHSKGAPCSHQQIPLFEKISSGISLASPTNVNDYIISDHAKTEGLFAMRMQNDSMIMAHILPNDVLIAQQHASINNQDIVVAMIDGEEATVKRFARSQDKIILSPENDALPVLEYDAHRVTIVGKVIEVRRGLPFTIALGNAIALE